MLATLLASAALAARRSRRPSRCRSARVRGDRDRQGATFYVGPRDRTRSRRGRSTRATSARARAHPGAVAAGARGVRAQGARRQLYVAGGPTASLRLRRAARVRTSMPELFSPTAGSSTTSRRRAGRRSSPTRATPLIYVYDRRAGTSRRCRSAATTSTSPGFNANGIAATPNGKRLIIVQSITGSCSGRPEDRRRPG